MNPLEVVPSEGPLILYYSVCHAPCGESSSSRSASHLSSATSLRHTMSIMSSVRAHIPYANSVCHRLQCTQPFLDKLISDKGSQQLYISDPRMTVSLRCSEVTPPCCPRSSQSRHLDPSWSKCAINRPKTGKTPNYRFFANRVFLTNKTTTCCVRDPRTTSQSFLKGGSDT